MPCILHKWIAVEVIGHVITYRCAKCGVTKTRVR